MLQGVGNIQNLKPWHLRKLWCKARYPAKLLSSNSLKKFQKYVVTTTGRWMNKTEDNTTSDLTTD